MIAINAIAQASMGFLSWKMRPNPSGRPIRGNGPAPWPMWPPPPFFPAKPLGGYGDGGAIFTDDDDLAASLALHPGARPGDA